jgi:hypothetical protein
VIYFLYGIRHSELGRRLRGGPIELSGPTTQRVFPT